MVRCVVKTRRMIFVVKNYQVNVPIFFRVQLVFTCHASFYSVWRGCLGAVPRNPHPMCKALCAVK